MPDEEKVVVHQEFPKWVKPHDSHVVRKQDPGAPEAVSVLGFDEFHVDRNTGVTVLVASEDEEARTSAPRDEPKAAEVDPPTPPVDSDTTT